MKSFYLLSLGCAKNTVDSDSIGTLLLQQGYQSTANPQEADLLIVNTCGFIAPARTESIESLQELSQLKNENQMLIAAGCMTQLYADEVIANVPKIDGVLGSRHWMDIVELIQQIGKNKNRNLPPFHLPDEHQDHPVEDHVHRTSLNGKSAYLKIAEGCRRNCAFCSIPSIKGTLVSRSPQSILADASYLQAQGVKELILIAQDTSDYGVDKADGYTFTYLIKDILEQTPNIPWIRMLYAFPGCINDDFIQLMANNARFLPYLDIPLQHAHPSILKSMHRPFNIDETRQQLKELRKVVPNLVLRTTFIVGYPGEGEAEFQTLLDFVEEMQFDRVGVFPFYYEAGTPSAPLGDPISEEVKQERIDRLMTLQQKISLQKNQAWVGKTMTILIEGQDRDQNISIGRSFRDAPEIDGLVFIEGLFEIGDMVTARITDALPYDLMARPVKSKRK